MRPRLLVLAVFASVLLLSACEVGRQHCPADDPSLPFSNATRVGDTVYVAGHLGLDPDTGMAPEDPAEEARLLMGAFERTLARVDMDMDDLVQVQVHCSDVTLYDTFNAAYRERFRGPFPARAFLGSGPLLRGCRFEMLGIARRR